MKSGISVIICCYNSAKRLPETLRHLAGQKVKSEVLWEVVIVDNNSIDNTAAVSRFEWQQYALSVPFRVVLEPQAGLSYAREKGFSVASFEYVLFCDDDNWLEENYVQSAFEIMQGDSSIGVLGGVSVVVSQGQLPVWFEEYQENYAVGSQGTGTIDVTDLSGFVWGAGTVIRQTAWLQLKNQDFFFLQTGRKGKSLSSGEDVELCFFLKLIGYRIFFSDRLKLKHSIPKERFSWSYFRKLRRGVGSTSAYMEVYHYLEAAIQNGHGRSYPLTSTLLKEVYSFILYPKQLYFFIFKDLELEQHIINREYRLGRIIAFLDLRRTYDLAYDNVKKALACGAKGYLYNSGDEKGRRLV